MSFNEIYEKELSFQADRRRATVEFISIISDLWYDDTIELIIFRNQLIDRNVSEILNDKLELLFNHDWSDWFYGEWDLDGSDSELQYVFDKYLESLEEYITEGYQDE